MTEEGAETPTYSVCLRLRRVTVEYAYVRVPVTQEIMQTDDHGETRTHDEGYAHIDPKKMVRRGIDIAQAGQTRWYREEETIEPHPIQKAPEPEEAVG
jgi:hypothetical protein